MLSVGKTLTHMLSRAGKAKQYWLLYWNICLRHHESNSKIVHCVLTLKSVDDLCQHLHWWVTWFVYFFLGYASSASGGAGLYNSNVNAGQTYGSKYPYSNQYSGFANAGGSAGGAFPFYQPYAPLPPFATPYDFQNAFQQYYNQLSSFNAKYGRCTRKAFYLYPIQTSLVSKYLWVVLGILRRMIGQTHD